MEGGGEADEEKKDGRKQERHTLCPLQRSQLGEGRTHTGEAHKPYCDWVTVCVCMCVCECVRDNMYFNLSLFSCQVNTGTLIATLCFLFSDCFSVWIMKLSTAENVKCHVCNTGCVFLMWNQVSEKALCYLQLNGSYWRNTNRIKSMRFQKNVFLC